MKKNTQYYFWYEFVDRMSMMSMHYKYVYCVLIYANKHIFSSINNSQNCSNIKCNNLILIICTRLKSTIFKNLLFRQKTEIYMSHLAISKKHTANIIT